MAENGELVIFCGSQTCQKSTIGITKYSSTVSIDSAVFWGSSNPKDTREIQNALNRVPQYHGGPNPAKASLVDQDLDAPLNPDGICGRYTDNAIKRFQRKQFPDKTPDGRIDKDQWTIQKLREIVNAQPMPGFQPPSTPEVMAEIYSRLPEVLAWIHKAILNIDLARYHVLSKPGQWMGETYKRAFQLASKYFHLAKKPEQMIIHYLNFIKLMYERMREVVRPLLQVGPNNMPAPTPILDRIFPAPEQVAPGGSLGLGFTTAGGAYLDANAIFEKKNQDGSTTRLSARGIYIFTDRLKSWFTEATPYVVLHELAHYCGGTDNGGPHDARILDYSYHLRPEFFKLDTFQAIRCADCYSQFAAEVTLGRQITFARR